jgi:hypothetical protein
LEKLGGKMAKRKKEMLKNFVAAIVDLIFSLAVFSFLYYTCWLPSQRIPLPQVRVQLDTSKEISAQEFERMHVNRSRL